MNDLRIIVRTLDRTKKAEITVSPQQTGNDIVKAALDHWNLSFGNGYCLANATQEKHAILSNTLEASGVASGDVLVVEPVLC